MYRVVRGVPVTPPVPEEPEQDDPVEQKRQNRLRKAFATATDLGFTVEMRHELAQMLPSVDKDDGGSWKELNPMQLHDLITMMEGYIFISHLKGERSEK